MYRLVYQVPNYCVVIPGTREVVYRISTHLYPHERLQSPQACRRQAPPFCTAAAPLRRLVSFQYHESAGSCYLALGEVLQLNAYRRQVYFSVLRAAEK